MNLIKAQKKGLFLHRKLAFLVAGGALVALSFSLQSKNSPQAPSHSRRQPKPTLQITTSSVVAICHDSSKARFEVQRIGSAHYLSGTFRGTLATKKSYGSKNNTGITAQETEVAFGLSYEFSNFSQAVSEIEEPTNAGNPPLVSFQSGAGQLQPLSLQTKLPFGQNTALAVQELFFFQQDNSQPGTIRISTNKNQLELAGCFFNLEALQRIRGEEDIRYVAALK